jgi:O-succinylbenzoic acid--CoA ligase
VSALEWGGRAWTHPELVHWAAAIEADLRQRGVRAGDRVATSSPNHPALVALFHACLRLKAILVPLNARLTEAEREPLLHQVQPAAVLVEQELDRLMELTPNFDSVLAGWEPEQVAAILFTSGTTGAPKGAMLTIGNFVASARASAQNLGALSSDRWLCCLPLFHIGGLAMLMRCVVNESCFILHSQFDESAVSAALDEGVTHLSLVGTTLRRLIQVRAGRPVPSSLRAVLVGGGPVPHSILAEARALGMPVLQTYGLTEACSQVATENPKDADGTTAGRPLAGVRVRIVDEDRRELPPGAVGEIEVAGPTVMPGYWQGPVQGEWLRTRDLGRFDDQGRLIIDARRVDLIISGGENIYPIEIERVLSTHPLVIEVAVIARPDEDWGQVPVAAVVAREPGLDEAKVIDWCRARLSRFKVPKAVKLISTLPRNAGGKVDRAQLARLFA